jgi:hypothetical protein
MECVRFAPPLADRLTANTGAKPNYLRSYLSAVLLAVRENGAEGASRTLVCRMLYTGMQLKKKRWLVIGTALILATFLLYPVGPYRERNSYRCTVCFAKRDVFRWSFGSWHSFSFPITGSKEVISEKTFGEKFLREHKTHQWEFAQGSPYYWGCRWGGCALGRGRHVSQVFEMYEMVPDFRDFIDEQLKSGTLSSNTVVAIFSDRSREETLLQKQGNELIDGFFARR